MISPIVLAIMSAQMIEALQAEFERLLRGGSDEGIDEGLQGDGAEGDGAEGDDTDDDQ
jgi:hypothetical protein